MQDKTKGFFIILICALAFIAVWFNLLLLVSPELFTRSAGSGSYESAEFENWSHPRASLSLDLPDKYDVEFSEEFDFEQLVQTYKIYSKAERDHYIFISLRKEEWEPLWEVGGSASGILPEEGEEFAELLGAKVYWTRPGLADDFYDEQLLFDDPDTDMLDRWGRGEGYTISGEYYGVDRQMLKEVISALKYAR
jgi:hypothetical protein